MKFILRSQFPFFACLAGFLLTANPLSAQHDEMRLDTFDLHMHHRMYFFTFRSVNDFGMATYYRRRKAITIDMTTTSAEKGRLIHLHKFYTEICDSTGKPVRMHYGRRISVKKLPPGTYHLRIYHMPPTEADHPFHTIVLLNE